MKKEAEKLLILSLVALMGFASAASITDDLHLTIQVTNSTGTPLSGTYDFIFNISTSSDCSDASIVYTNSSTLETDSRGVVNTYLPDVTLNYDQQYWLCYYRDGTLQNSVKIAKTPYAFRATYVNSSGIQADSNLAFSGYNITADYFFGNGSQLTGINAGETLWNANYSAFLNHITWANAVNGTLALSSDLANYYTASQIETNLSNYLTSSQILGFDYYNSTDFNIANYYTASQIESNLSNYYLASNPSGYVTWANAVNGTLLPTSTFNTNYTTNDPVYRSFASNYSDYLTTKNYALNDSLWTANYSTFLTHITWANAVNGTLANTGTANTFGAFNQTFDTNTLFIDSVSDRVGIGTTTPLGKLTIGGDSNSAFVIDSNTTDGETSGALQFRETTNYGGYLVYAATTNPVINGDSYTSDANYLILGTNNNGDKVNAINIYRGEKSVGIGTPFTVASGQSDLYVYNPSENADLQLWTASGYNSSLWFRQTASGSSAARLMYSYPDRKLMIFNGDDPDNYSNVRLTFDNDGNVGIGTTSPQKKLHVVGTDYTSSAIPSDSLLSVENDGSVGINIGSSAAGNGDLSFSDNADSRGLLRYAHGDDSMRFYTASNLRVLISSIGNVGINTSTPQNTLNVIGTGNFTTGLYVNEKNVETAYDYATNGTYLTEETLWNANYSDYLTTKNYALNDSLWSLNYSDYLTTKNYALNDSLWTSNYSNYLTLFNWNKTYADTLYSGIEWDYNQTTPAINTVLGFDYYNSTDFNIADYATLATIIGFGYYNLTSFDIADYYTSSQTDTEISNANTSLKNYVDSQDATYNTSLKNYVDAQDTTYNNSLKAYGDATYILSANEGNLNVNSSNYLDGYDASYFLPLNTSVVGDFDFNGGWQNNGLSILGGDIYAQTGFFYNITSLNVNNLNINGSLIPQASLDNQFDLGNSSLRWNDLFLGGNAYVNGTAAANNLQVGDTVLSNLIPSDNAKDLGSAAARWRVVYADQINVNNITAGEAAIGGTSFDTFTIFTNNSDDDLANVSLAFERGTPSINAVLKWDASSKRFDFNFPVYIGGSNNLTVGANAFFADGNLNRIGIGTTSPSNSITIVETTTDVLNISAGKINNNLLVGGSFSLGSQKVGTGQVVLDYPSQGSLDLRRSGAAIFARFDNQSRFGLGTLTPQNQLNVIGDINATTSVFSQDKNLSIGYDYAVNGTYLTSETNWNANYSTFLTHITWANAVNGTLALNSSLGIYDTAYNYATNGTYTTWANAYNGTLAKTDAANTFGAFNQTFDTSTLFIDSVSNKVGIGTTSPLQMLDVYASGTNDAAALFSIQSASSTSSGPDSPGTIVDDATVGTQAWSNPGNAATSNDVYANADLASGVVSHYLKATNFGFNIPPGSTIEGIEIFIEKVAYVAVVVSDIYDSEVKIVKSDGTLGTVNKADPTEWDENIDTNSTYGNSTDLWGETWTAEDINDADFGVVISAEEQAVQPGVASIDHIVIKVYYSEESSSSWTIGSDYSDSGNFKISNSNSLGTNDGLILDSAGTVNVTGSIFSQNKNLSIGYDYATNGTYLASETNWNANYSDYLTTKNYALNDSLWTANYSTFLTHITWANAVNGTLLPTSTFNTNYTTNDPVYRSWSLNYSDYLTTKNYALNDSLWSLNYSDYLTTKNYALNDSLWTANYSTFLTHITWANAVNGTLALSSDLGNYYTASQVETNLSNYFTSSQILGFDYYNSTDFSISDYFAKSDILGFNYYNSTDFNIANYYTASQIESNLSNYYLASNPSGYINWANAVNGTLLPTSTFNTNYTTNDPVYRSFASNYSTFLTHITWANAYNGTLAKTNAANTFGAFNQTFDTSTLFINSVSDRIGIGTTAPTYKLDVRGDINATNITIGGTTIYHNGTGICIGSC